MASCIDAKHVKVGQPCLSICVPTFNRSDLILTLAISILAQEGNFELCIHVDGSTDCSLEKLRTLSDSRLRLFDTENYGRASAIQNLVQKSRGKFLMVFDDDDALYGSGLEIIISDCTQKLEEQVGGYIYHFESSSGMILGSYFRSQRSNFMKLRLDEKVKGDKKEVVDGDIIRKTVSELNFIERRIPTSLLWSLVALDYDVICRNIIIGRKTYIEGGLSSNIRKLKRNNPAPMYKLYCVHCLGFMKRRYSSKKYFAKALVAASYYFILYIIKFRIRSWKRSSE